jgi:hypothetical protein
MDVGIKDREEESTWTGTQLSLEDQAESALRGWRCFAWAVPAQGSRRGQTADWQQAHAFDPSDTRETRLAHRWPRLSARLQQRLQILQF